MFFCLSLGEPRPRLDATDARHVHVVLLVLLIPALAPLQRGLPAKSVAEGAVGIGLGVGAHAAAGDLGLRSGIVGWTGG